MNGGPEHSRRSHTAFVFVDPVSQYTRLLDRVIQEGLVPICVLIHKLEGVKDAGEAERVAASYHRTQPRFAHVLPAVSVTSAVERLQDVADRESLEIVGVTAADSETGQEYADLIAASLGVPHNVLSKLRSRRDKAQMKMAVMAAGLRCAKFTRCRSVESVSECMSGHVYPVVVKTPCGSGTTQVWVCHTEQQVRECVGEVLQRPDYFGRRAFFALIEEYLGGTEYAVNMFCTPLEVQVTDLWQYTKVETAKGVVMYRRAELLDATDPKFANMVQYAKGVARAVGINLGPSHLEVKMEEGKEPVMVEIGARLAGGWKSSLTMLVVPGWDAFKAIFNVFLGRDVLFPRTFRPTGSVFHCFCALERGGYAKRILGIEGIMKLATYRGHVLHVEEGQYIQPTTDLFSHPLMVFLAGNGPFARAKVLEDEQRVHDLFQVEFDDTIDIGASLPEPHDDSDYEDEGNEKMIEDYGDATEDGGSSSISSSATSDSTSNENSRR
mmetsp:Transcript_19756/g.32923  ORF Transcript_19756/g.32923 Transcript_19756/m.32923 type:complete len:496 (+) Transcript_19756:168-1655(+)